MALTAKNLSKLLEMQRLNDEVCARTRLAQRALRDLKALERDVQQLAALYQSDWLSLRESPSLGASDRQRIEQATAPGGYAILGEGTIWDSLQEARQAQLNLAKFLVKNLS